MFRKAYLYLILFSLLYGCNTATPTSIQPGTTAVPTLIDVTNASSPTLPPPLSPTPQPLPTPATYGPSDFPTGFNPLTGQPVADPSQLTYPALLLSISHFPPAARPQAGFSFTPFVYEYYITEGSTRHVGVFYGEVPAPEIPLHGDCEVRTEPLTQ